MGKSTTPVSIIAAFYASEARARDVLRGLKQMEKGEAMEMLAAAVIVRQGESDTLRIEEAADFGPQVRPAVGTAAVGVIDILFPPWILAVRPVGRAAEAALGHFIGLGIQFNLLREIGENLSPGGGALVAVIEERWAKAFGSPIAGYQNLARFALDADAAARLTSESQ